MQLVVSSPRNGHVSDLHVSHLLGNRKADRLFIQAYAGLFWPLRIHPGNAFCEVGARDGANWAGPDPACAGRAQRWLKSVATMARPGGFGRDDQIPMER